MESWLSKELSECSFKDRRLGARFEKIVSAISCSSGKSIPQVCEDWSMTKAAYRFLSNERVEESEIFSGHFRQTAQRIAANKDVVLVLHDTTEFSFKRINPDEIGFTRKGPTINPPISTAFKEEYRVCGVLMLSLIHI